MKRILFIIPYVPYPLDSGGNQAFFNMVDYIRQKYSVAVLLYPKSQKQKSNVESLKKIWSNVEFFIFTPDGSKGQHSLYYKWLKKIQASITRKIRRIKMQDNTYDGPDIVHEKSVLSRSLFERFVPGYVEYVANVSKRGFDIIQVEFYSLIGLGYLLPEDVQTIFVHHELMYVRNEKEMSLFQEVTEEERMLFRIAKDWERNALLTYKHIIALTEVDHCLLADFLGRKERIYHSPAVVQIADSSELKFVPVNNNRLTFVGSKAHFPNLDAVLWFCEEVAPNLHKRGFQFTLQVVGQWHGSSVKKLQSAYPYLELEGYVEQLHPFLNNSIFLVPVRIGSGMRMKILDGVLAKSPFVTTTKGVEGIDLRDGEECLVADSAEDFADAIIRLASDPDLQERLVSQADARLQELYNPQLMLERRLSVYEQVLRTEE